MSADPIERQVFADGLLLVSWHRYGSDVLVISLAGELDESSIANARRVIFEVVAERRDDLLVIDLSMLEFIDPSGIALLFALADFATGTGLRIIPSRAPGVERVMKLTGLADHAQIAEDRSARVA